MYLDFACGSTRCVILVGQYAIKIARFRPLRPFIKLFESIQKKQVRGNLEKHHRNPLLAVIKYLLAGIVANRTEYRLYKKYKSELLVPTVFTIFWLVNIQRRGEPVADEKVKSHYLWNLFKEMETPVALDILQAKQFCFMGGCVRLADYGIDGLEFAIAGYKN